MGMKSVLFLEVKGDSDKGGIMVRKALLTALAAVCLIVPAAG
jgi:hypothetical protein